MQRAYDKYKQWSFLVIEKCDASEALRLEQAQISKHWGNPRLLNASSNAYSFLISEEGREKTKERNRSRVWTDESRKKVSDSRKGKAVDLTNRRAFNGHENPNAKLNESQIEDLLNRRRCGETIKSLADTFNINRTTVTRICSRFGVFYKPKAWSDKMRASQAKATERNPKRYSRNVSGTNNPRHKAKNAALIAEYGRIKNL
jgi:hypothetical protein